MPWREPNVETMPGRVLVGRPDGALARVATYSDLFKVCRLIVDAYKKHAPDEMELQFHVVFLRASSRFAEQLVHVDLSRMDITDDPATFCAERVAEGIEILRGANMAPSETLSAPLPGAEAMTEESQEGEDCSDD